MRGKKYSMHKFKHRFIKKKCVMYENIGNLTNIQLL